MYKKYRNAIVKVFLILLLLSGSVFNVMARPPDRKPHRWDDKNPMVSCLNLTPEQTKNIQALNESYERDIAPLRMQEFERNAELKMLWMQMNPNPEKIKAKQKEIHDLRLRVDEKTTDLRMGFRNILTPEQLLKFLTSTFIDGMKHLNKGDRMRQHGIRPGMEPPFPLRRPR